MCVYHGHQQTTLMGPDSCLCALAAAGLKEQHRPLCSDGGTEKRLQPDSKYSHHICRDSWSWRGFCLSFFPPPNDDIHFKRLSWLRTFAEDGGDKFTVCKYSKCPKQSAKEEKVNEKLTFKIKWFNFLILNPCYSM